MNQSLNWPLWFARFQDFLQRQHAQDPSHDLAHIQRVVANAQNLTANSPASLEIIYPAAWLHDCVTLPKDAPNRHQASRLAADAATTFLHQANYPTHYIDAINHAIAAHSFSAQIPPQTLEAKIVQDADRLDALGAIGIARCFTVGGALGRPLYTSPDPFCHTRTPNDLESSLDHFYTKLLTLADTMQTEAGRAEARRRTTFLRQFLDQLAQEITLDPILP
ncbi:MAG TPA: HD domain-containing protein [Anaerolineae bacterium]|nr:HD domain-containing protein [Anaerolineae bacterium]